MKNKRKYNKHHRYVQFKILCFGVVHIGACEDALCDVSCQIPFIHNLVYLLYGYVGKLSNRFIVDVVCCLLFGNFCKI